MYDFRTKSEMWNYGLLSKFMLQGSKMQKNVLET